MSALFFGTAVVSLGLGALTRRLGSERALARACMLGSALAFAAQALTLTKPTQDRTMAPHAAGVFVALSLALAFCQFPLGTTLTALSTSAVPPHAKGTSASNTASSLLQGWRVLPSASMPSLNTACDRPPSPHLPSSYCSALRG